MVITIETIVSGIAIIVFAIIGFFGKKIIDDLEKKIEKLESKYDELKDQHAKEMSELKINYLSRFEQVKKDQYSIRDEILTEINHLKIEIIKHVTNE